MSNAQTRAAVLLGALGVTLGAALAVPAIASADGSDVQPGWSNVVPGPPGLNFAISLNPQLPNWLPPSPCDWGQQACVLPSWLPQLQGGGDPQLQGGGYA